VTDQGSPYRSPRVIGYPSPPPALEAETEAPSPLTVDPRIEGALEDEPGPRAREPAAPEPGLAASSGAQADTEPPNGAATAAGRGEPRGGRGARPT